MEISEKCKTCENRVIALRVHEQLRQDNSIAEKDDAGVYRPMGIDATIRRKAIHTILRTDYGPE